jgi:hypothetical protein
MGESEITPLPEARDVPSEAHQNWIEARAAALGGGASATAASLIAFEPKIREGLRTLINDIWADVPQLAVEWQTASPETAELATKFIDKYPEFAAIVASVGAITCFGFGAFRAYQAGKAK